MSTFDITPPTSKKCAGLVLSLCLTLLYIYPFELKDTFWVLLSSYFSIITSSIIGVIPLVSGLAMISFFSTCMITLDSLVAPETFT